MTFSERCAWLRAVEPGTVTLRIVTPAEYTTWSFFVEYELTIEEIAFLRNIKESTVRKYLNSAYNKLIRSEHEFEETIAKAQRWIERTKT